MMTTDYSFTLCFLVTDGAEPGIVYGMTNVTDETPPSDRPTIPTPNVEQEALLTYERELAVLGRKPDMGVAMAFAIFGDIDNV